MLRKVWYPLGSTKYGREYRPSIAQTIISTVRLRLFAVADSEICSIRT